MNEFSNRNRQIYERHIAGETYKELAESYGLSPARIFQLCRREAYYYEMFKQTMKKNDLIPKEEIASRNKCLMDDVNCANCRFCNWFTIDIDTATCHCSFWVKKVATKSFCNNFTIRYKEIEDGTIDVRGDGNG